VLVFLLVGSGHVTERQLPPDDGDAADTDHASELVAGLLELCADGAHPLPELLELLPVVVAAVERTNCHAAVVLTGIRASQRRGSLRWLALKFTVEKFLVEIVAWARLHGVG